MTASLKSQLLDLLSQWKSGSITERDVHEQSEILWDSSDWPEYSEDDIRSIEIEVLLHLDILHLQLIIRDDIPEIERFLNTQKGGEQAAWKRWSEYWEEIDMDLRCSELKDHPFYYVLSPRLNRVQKED